jgi:hypothetical protein
MSELSLLEQRKIEARVVIPLIRAFQSRFGKDEAEEIVHRFISEMAWKQGREIAEKMPGTAMEKVASLIPRFREGNAIEVVAIDQSETVCDFNVTRCRYAEFYQEMGAPDLGFLLSCSRDFALTKGLSDDLELRRTRTIMQGDELCDFRFRLIR